MKTIQIGNTGPQASQVILGLMRIADKSDAEIRALVDAALEAGITMMTMPISMAAPPVHHCEARFAEAMQLTAAAREEMVIQTKAGIREGFFDFSKAHILAAVEGSLKALRTDYIDILLLQSPGCSGRTRGGRGGLRRVACGGKVRHFGVSNQTPGQIELLKSAVRQPLICNQMQLSITHAPIIAQGVAVNMEGLEQSVDRTLGILDYSRLKGMTLQAWSPFQHKFFDGTFVGDRARCPELNVALDEIAAAHGITPTGVAAAWITRHPARIQVVLGTTQASARARKRGRRQRDPLSRGMVQALHGGGIQRARSGGE